jgi:hypothetical protein
MEVLARIFLHPSRNTGQQFGINIAGLPLPGLQSRGKKNGVFSGTAANF